MNVGKGYWNIQCNMSLSKLVERFFEIPAHKNMCDLSMLYWHFLSKEWWNYRTYLTLHYQIMMRLNSIYVIIWLNLRYKGNRNFVISSNHSFHYKQLRKIKWIMTVKISSLHKKRPNWGWIQRMKSPIRCTVEAGWASLIKCWCKTYRAMTMFPERSPTQLWWTRPRRSFQSRHPSPNRTPSKSGFLSWWRHYQTLMLSSRHNKSLFNRVSSQESRKILCRRTKELCLNKWQKASKMSLELNKYLRGYSRRSSQNPWHSHFRQDQTHRVKPLISLCSLWSPP